MCEANRFFLKLMDPFAEKKMGDRIYTTTPNASMTSNNIQTRPSNLISNLNRWNELHQSYLAKIHPNYYSGLYYTKENAENNAKVHATLQYLAENGQLHVYRHSGGGEWYHSTDILLPNGDVCETTVGFITNVDVILGKWDEKYVKHTEPVDEEHIRICLMISNNLPHLPEFCNENGEELDLGMNDDYFEGFNIVIHKSFVKDNF